MCSYIVATLGPHGTCSEIVLLDNLWRFPQPATIKLLASYEKAAKEVCDGSAECIFVAAAYPSLNVLIFDPTRNLRIVDCFLADTPALVIAAREPMASTPQTIAVVDAPVPIVQAAFPGATIIPAKSNADAAHQAKLGAAEAGFTTSQAAEKSGLTVIRSFGSVPMAWVVLAAPTNSHNAKCITL